MEANACMSIPTYRPKSLRLYPGSTSLNHVERIHIVATFGPFDAVEEDRPLLHLALVIPLIGKYKGDAAQESTKGTQLIYCGLSLVTTFSDAPSGVMYVQLESHSRLCYPRH